VFVQVSAAGRLRRRTARVTPISRSWRSPLRDTPANLGRTALHITILREIGEIGEIGEIIFCLRNLYGVIISSLP
jgi:hypothetical protein